MPLNSTLLCDTLAPYHHKQRWIIAYSGGVDSHCLLHLLSTLKKNNPRLPELLAVHIDHQLQPKYSQQWAEHCQQQAQQLNVPIEIYQVDVACAARESLEDKARKARYEIFERLVKKDDVLLMGHHIDDQVETLLLRLLRGSGSKGLGAMPSSRALGEGVLFRPLLVATRSDIEQYARDHVLTWIEDTSNQDEKFDRNFLRQRLLPLLAERWPFYRQPLVRSAELSAESALLNTELAALDMERLGISASSHSLAINVLNTLSVIRQKNVLRYWLELRQLAVPSAQKLQALIDQVVEASDDARPLLCWSNGSDKFEARRFNGELFIMRALSDFDVAANYPWRLNQKLLIDGVGELSFESIATAYAADVGDEGLMGLDKGLLEQGTLSVGFRQGGERCRPAGRKHSQSLKKLFQEYQVAPWLRDRTPLLFVNDELAAVVGYWVCSPFASAKASALCVKLNEQIPSTANV
jgi:tRNA(Ile)-lysidine synthase